MNTGSDRLTEGNTVVKLSVEANAQVRNFARSRHFFFPYNLHSAYLIFAILTDNRLQYDYGNDA